MLTALQRQLIYFPGRAGADELAALASRLGLQAWHDGTGSPIGWRSMAPSTAQNRMLVFHGNAGYALDRQYFVAGFQALQEQWDVFLFEYPGYGARQGTPSEESFKSAAADALKVLLAEDSRRSGIQTINKCPL